MQGDQQQSQTLFLNTQQLKYFKNTDKMTKYERDIIPGQYEGGFKLWQCTIDLLNYIEKHAEFVTGKNVVEMGCGHGLPGILAKKMGGNYVCLQDYNNEVIQKVTLGSIKLNGLQHNEFQCISGDWAELKTNIKYDTILGSQVTYTKDYYPKIIAFIREFMKQDGVCILANKFYYFGVGGNIPQFKTQLVNAGLKWETLEKIVPQKGGNKKQILKITF